jgi:hypothetical protein
MFICTYIYIKDISLCISCICFCIVCVFCVCLWKQVTGVLTRSVELKNFFLSYKFVLVIYFLMKHHFVIQTKWKFVLLYEKFKINYFYYYALSTVITEVHGEENQELYHIEWCTPYPCCILWECDLCIHTLAEKKRSLQNKYGAYTHCSKNR